MAKIVFTGQDFDFSYAKAALEHKGFTLHVWLNDPLSLQEFNQILLNSCQLWIISNTTIRLGKVFLDEIKNFFEKGIGQNIKLV